MKTITRCTLIDVNTFQIYEDRCLTRAMTECQKTAVFDETGVEQVVVYKWCPLNYSILYYTILYYTIIYYTILYYTILYYTILHYTTLYYYIT